MSCDVGEVTERLENKQNFSVASPTSQFILQPLFRFSYVTSSSLNSPGEPPIPCKLGFEVKHKKKYVEISEHV